MAAEKRFYYKFNKDFFNDVRITALKNETNGYLGICIYQASILLALDDGRLALKNGPISAKIFAKNYGFPPKKVALFWEKFIDLGLFCKDSAGVYCIADLLKTAERTALEQKTPEKAASNPQEKKEEPPSHSYSYSQSNSYSQEQPAASSLATDEQPKSSSSDESSPAQKTVLQQIDSQLVFDSATQSRFFALCESNGFNAETYARWLYGHCRKKDDPRAYFAKIFAKSEKTAQYRALCEAEAAKAAAESAKKARAAAEQQAARGQQIELAAALAAFPKDVRLALEYLNYSAAVMRGIQIQPAATGGYLFIAAGKIAYQRAAAIAARMAGSGIPVKIQLKEDKTHA